jgi:hypothetical protein
MTPRRRGRRNPFDQAALAPRLRSSKPLPPIDLYPTPYRKYLLAQARDGRIRWHQRLGWRLHAEGQKPQTQNANVRDMVRAGWLTESGDATSRALSLTLAGEKHAGDGGVPDVS